MFDPSDEKMGGGLRTGGSDKSFGTGDRFERAGRDEKVEEVQVVVTNLGVLNGAGKGLQKPLAAKLRGTQEAPSTTRSDSPGTTVVASAMASQETLVEDDGAYIAYNDPPETPNQQFRRPFSARERVGEDPFDDQEPNTTHPAAQNQRLENRSRSHSVSSDDTDFTDTYSELEGEHGGSRDYSLSAYYESVDLTTPRATGDGRLQADQAVPPVPALPKGAGAGGANRF